MKFGSIVVDIMGNRTIWFRSSLTQYGVKAEGSKNFRIFETEWSDYRVSETQKNDRLP